MAQKKRRGTGRVTPKGTTDPKAKTARRGEAPGERTPPHELMGNAGKPRTKPVRPITHNRGNR